MAGMPSVHTAGIFSDMTVDGPEIGDLVVIVDKAKNLPNRKTMGKQDPYCAARLGKEAKKTETDKRGGQTPRWDQELRFTVHDSPDYHQLKVSVFNDDKRTDLIGETWVNLDNVLLRGGGRSDGWHSLNCKGRYAGEIRMELTYYDTRPKEEQPSSRRRESAKNGQEPVIRESMSGPRQPKPVTRRPLPANPINVSPVHATEHGHPTLHRPAPPRTYDSAPGQLSHPITHSRELPTPYGPPHLKRDLTQPVSIGHTSSGMGVPYQHRIPEGRSIPVAQHDLRLEQYGHHGSPGAEDPIPSKFPGRSQDVPEGMSAPPQSEYGDYIRESSHSLSGYPQNQASPVTGGHVIPPLNPHGGRNNGRGAEPHLSSSPGDPYQAQPAPPIRHHHSAPEYGEIDSQPTHYRSHDDPFVPHQSEEHPHRHAPEPLRYRSHNEEYVTEGGPSTGMASEEPEDIPPPPPAHRISEPHKHLRESPAQLPYTLAQPPVPGDTENSRGVGMSHSPNTYQSRPSTYPAPLSIASGCDHPRTNHVNSPPAMYEQPPPQHLRGAKTTSTREHYHALPPSLVPGYDPRDAAAEVDSMRRQSGGHVEPQEFNENSFSGGATHYPGHHRSQSDLSQVARGRPHDAVLQRPHGVPAPLVKPIAVTPEPVRIPRKSISPSPAATPEGRRRSEVPFSPDAYDAFNPNVGSSSINQPGPQYHTPDQAQEVSRQRQREAQRGAADEPIIGWDGRVIDPSDHLPSDTWAPEPERKTPIKTPSQTETRSRPSPQGAQPMPPSSRRPARPAGASRPHSISTPLHIQSSGEPHTPNSASRSRLQKRIHPPPPTTPTSPNIHSTSPVGPYGSQTPRSLPRAATDLALREHENYGYERTPPYAPYGNDVKNSPLAAGTPPVPPAKVPIRGNGPEDYSALSEELSTIEIGSGRRRVAKRIQY
ncbi:MAG: hypothetical protein M1816_006347 [Peltula sp. TS41687]|nr:MAG: hypothetical protein M1816_006347 [Peltula sp. TS41687]